MKNLWILMSLVTCVGLGCSGNETAQVGDSVPSAVPGEPAGTVTDVTPAATSTPEDSSTYSWVTITYPSAWNCPSDAWRGNTAGGSSSSATSAAGLTESTCERLADLRRPALKAQARATLENQRQNLIRQNCTGRTEQRCQDSQGAYVDSSKCYQSGYRAADAGVWASGGASAVLPGVGGSGGSSGASQYSTTNTQVVTVDEADYVKNDNNTIFVLGSDGLHVIDAWPAAATHEVAKLALPGEPRRLFLENNRLVVYTRMQASTVGSGAGSSNPSDQGCTYGYDCRFSSEGGHTLAIVFDVVDAAKPRELARYEFSGGYVASRRVGSFVYTVVHDTGAPQIPGLDYALGATSYAELQTAFATRADKNDALINVAKDDYFLPWTRRVKPDGTIDVTASCSHAVATTTAAGLSFVSLVAFDLTKLEPPVRTVAATNPGYVYASATALYLAADNANERDYSTSAYSYQQPQTSTVHKFSLAGTEIAYVGSAPLPGHILNQFAMDEDGGVLRVASTRGWVPSTDVQSYITTFGERNGALEQLGQVGGIGPGEDIRSVRFDGDRGFVVTFKKTDPLFVFDLVDPRAPRVLGELKIPGFSTYMQRLDANHLLAIGFTADDQGSYAFFNGIQIQIFDVTDLSAPALMWKKVIGTRGSNSEALTNHLAFNYFAPKKMLALPMTICEGGGNGVYGDKLTFAGLMAFDISLESGITEHGRLPFLDATGSAPGASCDQWWANSSSLVKRSIFMDDWIYGLSDAQLRVAALGDMSKPLQTLALY